MRDAATGSRYCLVGASLGGSVFECFTSVNPCSIDIFVKFRSLEIHAG